MEQEKTILECVLNDLEYINNCDNDTKRKELVDLCIDSYQSVDRFRKILKHYKR